MNAIISDHNPMGWRFDNTYSRLPDVFFAPAKPATFGAPRLAILNRRLADDLGLCVILPGDDELVRRTLRTGDGRRAGG